MIDVEDKVYGNIQTALRASFPNIYIYDEERALPSKFPCVTIIEADNYAYEKTQDSSSLENHAVLMYEVNVYSNKASGKKDECKQIQEIVDKEFQRLGFTRMSKVPISANNATIYRIVSRYSGVVSKNEEIYRR